MEPEHWRQIERLYHAALERAASERPAFLAQACGGDAEVRRQVETLLAHGEQAGSFLESPAINVEAQALAEKMVRDEKMVLCAGARLGPYEIQASLGAGGMGVVYQATDTTLGRPVALKIIRAELLANEESLRRFDREARVLASLNHPHIAAIHSIEESEGTKFLVLEYVPGPTLAERLRRGPLPTREALLVGKQIAEAMEAAHAKGIIHRDLKPANIKVNENGQVKVLDFGLAKSIERTRATVTTESPPTVSAEVSQKVTVLGTAAYMSPEQACGKELDSRTDIWSFGCVLYEALTAKRMFRGETVTEVLAAVIGREPDWQALPPDTPPAVSILLRRCLRKDPNSRLRDIGDARLELEEALAAPASGVAQSLAAPPVPVHRLVIGLLAGLVLGAIAMAIAAHSIWKTTPTARPVTRFAVPFAANEILPPSHSPNVTISPDGSTIAYAVTRPGVATATIYLRRVDEQEPKALPPDVFGMAPFFSPDGQWLGFYQGRTRTLKKVALTGGAPVTICPADAVAGATWGEDGNIVWAWFNLFTVPAAGGTPRTLLKVDISKGERFFRLPQYLPGGKAILFTIGTGDIESYEDGRIAVLDLKTGKYKVILEGGSSARYSPTGHLVYARGGNLLAVPFDLKKLAVTGQPFPLLDGIFSSRNTGMAAFSISSSGDLAYVPGPTEGGRRQLVWVDRQGQAKPFDLPPRSYLHPRLSPDEKQLAMEIEGPAHDIYSYDLSRGVMTRLTFDGSSHWPMWSPHGDQIAFRSWKTSGMSLWRMPADRSGPEEMLPGEGHMLSPESWSPDGKDIAYLRMDDMRHFDVWLLPLEGGKPRPILESSRFIQASPKFSPDGRWLAYCSNESGRAEVFVTQCPGPGARVQVSTDGGSDPVWRRDGGELYYRNGDKMMVVRVATHPKLTLSKPAQLWQAHYMYGSGASCGMPGVASANYDVTADGKRFVMIEDKDQDAVGRQVNVVLNFAEVIKRAEQARKISSP